MVAVPTILSITWLAQTVVAYALNKGIDKSISICKQDFESRLEESIRKTINDYDKKYYTPIEKDRYPFYKSEIILSEFLKFRMFSKQGYLLNQDVLKKELLTNPKVIRHTDEQIDNFFKIFDECVKSDEKLKNLELDAYYKEEIFNVSLKIDQILKAIPNFDEEKYLDKILSERSYSKIDLYIHKIDAVKNITADRNDNKQKKKTDTTSNKQVLINHLPEKIKNNKISFLLGIGGAGKTTSLKQILYKTAENRRKNNSSPLPILIECSKYEHYQNLNEYIHDLFNITSGSWTSIYANFIILVDGLNELSLKKQKQLLHELEVIIDNIYSATVLVTSRDGKIKAEIGMKHNDTCYEFTPLSTINIRKISKLNFSDDVAEQFISEFYTKYSNYEVISTPFFVVKSIEYYKQHRELPKYFGVLIDYHLKNRFSENFKTVNKEEIIDFDDDSLRETLIELAFYFRFVKPERSFKFASIKKCFKFLNEQDDFDKLEEFTVTQIGTILLKYEILIKDGLFYNFEHDLIVDYYASMRFAKIWRNHKNKLRINSYNDIWLFSAMHVKKEDYDSFIASVAEIDLILAAKCVMNMKSNAIELIKPYIMRCYETNRQYDDYLSTTAMKIIGKEHYLDFIKNEYASCTSSDKGKKRYLKIVLANFGVDEICNNVSERAEKEDAIPFMTFGNGDKKLWMSLPYNIKIERSRSRIQNVLKLFKEEDNNFDLTKNNITASIRTITRFGGNDNDMKLIKEVYENSSDYNTIYLAAFFMLYHNTIESIKFLKTNLRIAFPDFYTFVKEAYFEGYNLLDDNDDFTIIKLLEDSLIIQNELVSSAANKEINWENILNLANNKELKSDMISKKNKNVTHDSLKREVERITNKTYKLLNVVKLSEKSKIAILRILSDNNYLQEISYFWNLAIKNQIEGINEVINSVISSYDLIKSARILEQLNERKDCYISTNDILKLTEKNKNYWYKYDYYVILEYLCNSGEFIFAKKLLNRNLRKLLLKDYDSLNNIIFYKNECKTEACFEVRMVNTTIRFLILAQKVKKYIDKDIIYLSFTFDESGIYNGMTDVYSNFLSILTREEIDCFLDKEYKYNQSFLSALAGITKTKTRIAVVLNVVNKSERISLYKKIMQNYWCDEILDFLIKKLRSEQTENEIAEYESYLDYVTKVQAESFLKPILDKMDHAEKNRIINLWYDVAMNRKG